MPAYICVTCGVQAAPGDAPPPSCPICLDERQYVGWGGQRWTTLEELRQAGHRNRVEDQEPGLTAIWTTPQVAIGQRGLLVQTPAGNLLWDCISYLDGETIEAVRARGGLQAIAISHPHFYGSCVEWSDTFGGVPIYIHANERQWAQRPSPNYAFWEGPSVQPFPTLSLVLLGGHFDGATVCHWPAGAEGRGALLSGDTITVVQDRRWASFMYSYPNLIPLSADQVRAIADAIRPYPFARVYGAWEGRTIQEGNAAVERSAQRYIEHLRGQ